MDEGAVEAVVPAVELEVEAEGIGDEADDGVISATGGLGQPIEVMGCHPGSLGDVEPEGDRTRPSGRGPAGDGRGQGLRVHARVPLHRGRGVTG